MADKGSLLYVIGCATVSICICEAVSWLLVFRLEDFQRLHAQYASASKRLARKQEELATVAEDKKIDKKDKKLIMLEREFSRASRDLGTYKVSAVLGGPCPPEQQLTRPVVAASFLAVEMQHAGRRLSHVYLVYAEGQLRQCRPRTAPVHALQLHHRDYAQEPARRRHA
jgi:hypothetical protein